MNDIVRGFRRVEKYKYIITNSIDPEFKILSNKM